MSKKVEKGPPPKQVKKGPPPKQVKTPKTRHRGGQNAPQARDWGMLFALPRVNQSLIRRYPPPKIGTPFLTGFWGFWDFLSSGIWGFWHFWGIWESGIWLFLGNLPLLAGTTLLFLGFCQSWGILPFSMLGPHFPNCVFSLFYVRFLSVSVKVEKTVKTVKIISVTAGSE